MRRVGLPVLLSVLCASVVRSLMPDLETQILAAVAKKNYQPLKPKALARQLGVPSKRYADFRNTLRELLRQKRLEMGRGGAYLFPFSRAVHHPVAAAAQEENGPPGGTRRVRHVHARD